MSNLKNVIYLSNEDYEILVSTGSVTIGGTTLTYDENNLYITPDKLATSTEDGLMSAADKSKIDGLATVALSGSYNDLTNKPSIPSDSNLVHKTGDEEISGKKVFDNLWAVDQLTAAGDSFYFDVTDVDSDTTRSVAKIRINRDNGQFIGSDLTLYGHLCVYGDDDNDDPSKPDDKIQSADLDTLYFNTGITLIGDEDNYKISFPGKTGTFALVEDLEDCVTYEEALELLSGIAEIDGSSLVLPASAEIEGTTFTTSDNMTIDGSTLII